MTKPQHVATFERQGDPAIGQTPRWYGYCSCGWCGKLRRAPAYAIEDKAAHLKFVAAKLA